VLAELMCVGIRTSPAGNFMQGVATLGVTPIVGALCLGTALLIGLASSFIPAWGASRTSILEALRYSG
jgi:putative ABC transport system permease protein